MPGGDVVQRIRIHDVVQPRLLVNDLDAVAGVIPVGRSGGHTVQVVILRALLGVVVGDLLDKIGAGDDTHHLHAPAGSQGGHIIVNAVGHQGVVGDVAGGVNLLAAVGLLLRHREQGGADVLAAGEEHAVDALHHLSHVGGGVVAGLDLVGVLLQQVAGVLHIGALDHAVRAVAHGRAGDLVKFHRVAAGGLNDSLEAGIVLVVGLPGDADIGLADEGGAVLQHGLELALSHRRVGAVSDSVRQSDPRRGGAVIRGPGGEHFLRDAGILHDGGGSFRLGGLGVRAESVCAGAADQPLGIGQVDVALVLAVLRHVGEHAGLALILGDLVGQTGALHQELGHLAAGQGVALSGAGGDGHRQGETRGDGQGQGSAECLFHKLDLLQFLPAGQRGRERHGENSFLSRLVKMTHLL